MAVSQFCIGQIAIVLPNCSSLAWEMCMRTWPDLMGLPGPEQTSKIDHHSLSVLDDCGDESGCTFAKQVHHILPLDLGEDAPGTGVALNRLILRLSSIQASPWDGSLGSGLTSCRWILKVSKRTCPSAR